MRRRRAGSQGSATSPSPATICASGTTAGTRARTTEEIRAERPGWTLWGDGCPGGESSADVGARADRVAAELRAAEGDVAVFAHGHLLRVLGARWVGLDPSTGGRLALDTATVSILGHHREVAVLQLWNDPGAGRLPA